MLAKSSGFQHMLVKSFGFQPMLAESSGFQPMLAESFCFQPMLGESFGFQPMLAKSSGFQPMLAESSGFQPMLAKSSGFQPMLGESFGFHFYFYQFYLESDAVFHVDSEHFFPHLIHSNVIYFCQIIYIINKSYFILENCHFIHKLDLYKIIAILFSYR